VAFAWLCHPQPQVHREERAVDFLSFHGSVIGRTALAYDHPIEANAFQLTTSSARKPGWSVTGLMSYRGLLVLEDG